MTDGPDIDHVREELKHERGEDEEPEVDLNAPDRDRVREEREEIDGD